MTGRRPRVLVISLDPVGSRMAGLGIRCSEIAGALSSVAEVTLAAPGSGGAATPAGRFVSFEPHSPGALRPEIAGADMIVAQPQWPLVSEWLRRSPARIVFDLYAPETLETIESTRSKGRGTASLMVNATLDRLVDAFSIGDHFVCASELQANMWLGAMLGSRTLGRVSKGGPDALGDLIDLVPFGIPESPPPPAAGRIRSRFPSIASSDRIVIWNGGIWPWRDAPAAIRAIGEVSARQPDARLVFMGAPGSPASAAAREEAVSLARADGLLNRSVFFNDEWVPYEERGEWLSEADCAISLQQDHLETRFSFRTRLLDCLWSGLPAVCSSGDELSSLLASRGLASTAAPGDLPAAVAALERELEQGRESRGPAFEALRPQFTWANAVAPLKRWAAMGPSGRTDLRFRRGAGQRFRVGAYLALQPLLGAYQRRRPGRDGSGQRRS